MQRHSSALALAGLTIAGLALGVVLAFDVNPAIEATHDAIVATRRLEQHDTALGLALLRVRQGPSDDQAGDDGALVAAARAVEKESEPLLDRPSPAADADAVALAAARAAAGTQIRRQLQVLDDFKSALASSRGSVALLSGWAGDLGGGAGAAATVDDQVRRRANTLRAGVSVRWPCI